MNWCISSTSIFLLSFASESSSSFFFLMILVNDCFRWLYTWPFELNLCVCMWFSFVKWHPHLHYYSSHHNEDIMGRRNAPTAQWKSIHSDVGNTFETDEILAKLMKLRKLISKPGETLQCIASSWLSVCEVIFEICVQHIFFYWPFFLLFSTSCFCFFFKSLKSVFSTSDLFLLFVFLLSLKSVFSTSDLFLLSLKSV